MLLIASRDGKALATERCGIGDGEKRLRIAKRWADDARLTGGHVATPTPQADGGDGTADGLATNGVGAEPCGISADAVAVELQQAEIAAIEAHAAASRDALDDDATRTDESDGSGVDSTAELPFTVTPRLGERGVVFNASVGDDDVTSEKYTPGDGKRRREVAELWCGDDRLWNGATPNHAGVVAALEAAERDALARLDALESESSVVDAPSGTELDLSRIVRPELFHTAAVSGVCIPIAMLAGGRPRGTWGLYLRWADGRRERRSLESHIELAGGGRLWIHPQPDEPLPTALPGWSLASRAAWLNGAAAPDPVAAFKAVCRRIAFYIDFPQATAAGTAATLALWALLSYVYPAWSAVPYLSVGGPTSSGKTTLFGVLARMVLRPLAASCMTAAALFRTLHDQGGVLLLDEAERLREGAPEAGELRAILLSGYKRGSPAYRLEKIGERFRRIAFDVFGPKALAAIASLPVQLANRCIRLSMFRAVPDSPKPRRRIDADGEWGAMRDDLHTLALEYGPTWLELVGRDDVCPSGLSGREFELWQPLLALAAWLTERGADGLLPLVQQYAIHASESARDDATPELDEILLRLLAGAVVSGEHHRIAPGELLRRARAVNGPAFEKWSSKGVATTLNRYGLTTHKTGGVRVYGRVTVDAIRRVERAYAMDLGLPPVDVPHVPQRPPVIGLQDENGGIPGYVAAGDVPLNRALGGSETASRVREGT